MFEIIIKAILTCERSIGLNISRDIVLNRERLTKIAVALAHRAVHIDPLNKGCLSHMKYQFTILRLALGPETVLILHI